MPGRHYKIRSPHPTHGHLRRQSLLTALVAVALTAGCSSGKYVSIRSTPYSPLAEKLSLTSWRGPKASKRTEQVLRRYALAGLDHPQQLTRLKGIIDQEPSPEKLYSFAELAFLEGKRHEVTDPVRALEWFEASVAHAYLYLFDERYGRMLNPYDPQFRGACDLYNGSLESALRIVQKEGGLQVGHTHTIESCNQKWNVSVISRNPLWHPDDFERFEFVSDYDVSGLTNLYQTYGLGVPLIAVRKRHTGEEPSERLYPPGLSFPVTAFLRVVPETSGSAGPARTRQALLELHDPLAATDIVVGDVRVPLESDLSTPLAFFLNSAPSASKVATLGLLRPDKQQQLAGLYMTQPYDPSKIPVLFVHGLWSEPTTWTDMFNDLRSAPEIRQGYQFWFYLYPTGQPFWASAARLREDLAQMRSLLDPQRREPALDQMVLVGHSMGGLVSRMQTVDSGDAFWSTVSTQPFQLVKASEDTRRVLQATYFFGPSPSIRRVITLGTPHHGSEFANKYTRYAGQKLIYLPQLLVNATQELYLENPGTFPNGSSMNVKTSIDSLAPDSPILPVLLNSPAPPWVKYHNVVGVQGYLYDGQIPDDGSDGVVAYSSAHVMGVESEVVVDADHLHVHRHPLSVLEVRRILLEHLAMLRAFPAMPGADPYVTHATATDRSPAIVSPVRGF